MAFKRLVFRVHAVRRMVARGISEHEVRHVLDTGHVIEDYPQDQPYPSRLVLGFLGSRPVHVVAAENTQDQETIVVTVYEPDPARWDPTFRKKRKTT